MERTILVRILAEARDFSFPQNVQNGSGDNQPPAKWVLGFFDKKIVAGGMTPTTHLHLVLRLRMSSTIHLLPTECLYGMNTVNSTFTWIV